MRATFAISSAACRIDIGVAPNHFVKLTAFDELHAEVARAIALADFVDWNDTGMLQTGCGFGFKAKALQVRFARPLTKANDF